MLKTGILASVASIALTAGAAQAQVGAPMAAPMQPGTWNNAGWQPNGAPVYAPAPGQPMMAPHASMSHAPAAGYHRYERGQHVPRAYRDPSYTVSNWQQWGFAQPADGLHWARYYDDAVLLDANGTVVDAMYGVNWDAQQQQRAYYGQGQGYAGYPGQGYPAQVPGYGYGHQGTTVTHAGPNTVITTQVYGGAPGYAGGAPVYAGGAGYGYGYGYAGGGMIITPGTVTTTTTTTSDETVYRNVWAKKRVWHRPVRRIVHRAPPACVCGS